VFSICAVLLAVAPGAMPPASEPSIFRSAEIRPLILRAQSPGGFESLPDPNAPNTFAPPGGTFGPGQPPPFQPNPAPFQPNPAPFQPNPAPFPSQPFNSPGMGDPFLQDPNAPQIQTPYNPYAGPTWSFGANGPQPYRYGWTSRYDFTYMPPEGATQGLGDIGITGLDTEWEYTTPFGPAWIYSFTQEYDKRWWDGPTSSRTGPPGLRRAGLPEDLYRFGWDFELASPGEGPWSYQIAFNPSINTDFEQSITRDAWNFDGRAILFYRSSPQLLWAFGAGYWDRVNDRIIPYAGVIYTPDDRWEFRLVFPEPRISYFLGTPNGHASWVYVRGEYHVEAYQVELEYLGAGGRREKMEIADWRLMLGLRKEFGNVSGFLEAGWVFDRQVDFLHETPGFDIDSGFITRAGIRY
jgi:hypothetical protein